MGDPAERQGTATEADERRYQITSDRPRPGEADDERRGDGEGERQHDQQHVADHPRHRPFGDVGEQFGRIRHLVANRHPDEHGDGQPGDSDGDGCDPGPAAGHDGPR